MTKRLLCSVVAVAALGACGSDSPTGGDLCSKAINTINAFNTKNSACFPGGAATAPGSTCTQELANCTSADQALLNTFLDCLGGTPTCSVATIDTWSTAVQNCQAPVNSGASQACKTAIGFGS